MNKVNYLLIPAWIIVAISIIVIWAVAGSNHLYLPDAERTKIYEQEAYQAELNKTQRAFDKVFKKDGSFEAKISPTILGQNETFSLKESVIHINALMARRVGEAIPLSDNFLPKEEVFFTNEEPKTIPYVRVYPETYVQFRRSETANLREINNFLPPATSIYSPNNMGKDTTVIFENATAKCSLDLKTKQVDCESK